MRNLRERHRTRLLALGTALVMAGVIAAFVWFAAQSPSGEPSRPIRLATSDWAPYVMSEDSLLGPVGQLVQEVVGRSGYDPQIDFTSWEQVERQVATGAAVGAFPVVASDARRSQYFLSDPVLTFDYALFYDRRRGAAPRIDSGNDLRSLRVGTIAGYDYWDEFEANSTDEESYDNSLQAFEALARGDVDVVAEGVEAGFATLASTDFLGSVTDFDVVSGPGPYIGSRESLHLMAARTEAGRMLIDRFNAELSTFRTSDAYERLIHAVDSRSRTEVVLRATRGDNSLVQLYLDDSTRSAVTPDGTRAAIIGWPTTATSVREAHDELVKVKLVDGPESGRVLWVSYASIEMG